MDDTVLVYVRQSTQRLPGYRLHELLCERSELAQPLFYGPARDVVHHKMQIISLGGFDSCLRFQSAFYRTTAAFYVEGHFDFDVFIRLYVDKGL